MMKKLMVAFIGIVACLLTTNSIAAPKVAYSVHLESYNRVSDAVKGWKELVEAHTRYLGALTPRVSKFVVTTDNKKRVYYRLKAGLFLSRIMATQFCNTLKGRGLHCSVKRLTGKKLKGY